MPMNERKTEAMVERRLRRHEYYAPDGGITVEQQRSDTARVNKLLEYASKSGNGAGKPEFIIRSRNYSDFIIVVECKANPQKHESETRTKYSDYAVDGVLLYASFLSKEFDVLAIAVSGEDEASFRISHFLHLRGMNKAADWDAAGDVVSFDDYYQEFAKSDIKFRQDYDALLEYSRILNNQLQAKKITEAERGFLISGILIALQNRAFSQSYQAQRTAKQLALNLLDTIVGEFENANLPTDRRDILAQAFSFILHQPSLTKDKDFIVSLIKGINENINTFMRTHKYYDAIGQFYVEFLRYANNDKGLGIVLTPSHIAELFAELADVNENSVVFDNCCGTAGLLIAAMKVMIQDAGADGRIQKRIKCKQLFGIEFQPKIYALAVCNMILHGDGKTNVYRGDCFEDTTKILHDLKPTVGVLNPPYRNKTVKEDKEELEFVLNNLDCLEQGGKCVAIVPITCATAPSGAIGELKRRLLDKHTLEAVMSMPIELFHNSHTTVVTCVMVFTAKRPHPQGKKTWFGYWRDDGLVKTKHRGRIDLYGKWPRIKEGWVSAYRNKEIIDGISVMREVGPKDEWCAEAYLPTDYDSVDLNALLEAARRHAIARIMNESAERL
jgi:type I restriction enzyme M protein